MDVIPKSLSFLKKRVRLYLLPLFLILFLGIFLSFEVIKEAEAEDQFALNFALNGEQISSDFLIVQGNSLQPAKNPLQPEEEIVTIGQIEVVVTGYSSSPWETDDTPFLTAAGTSVREGIVATNILPFGTQIRLPELYGEKIFVVEDRMSSKKGYHIDVWFPSYWEALNFGAKRTFVEIIQEG